MPILKHSDIIEPGKVLGELGKEVDDLKKSLTELITVSKQVNKTGTGAEAKQRIDIAKQLEVQTNKLVVAETKQAQELARLKQLTKDSNDLAKAQAVLNDRLSGTEERLLAANTKLRIERKRLNTETIAGQTQLKKINAELDRNNAKILQNADALKKQKIGIGGYSAGIKDALGTTSQFVPVIGSATRGIGLLGKAFTTALGPIGLIIAAIAALAGAIKTFFTNSEEGQDQFARDWAAVEVIFGNIKDSIASFGKSLLEPKKLLQDIRDSFTSTFGEYWGGILDRTGAVIDKFFLNIRLGYEKVKDAFTDNTDAIEETRKKIEEADKRILEANKRIVEGAENAKKALTDYIDEQEREIKIAQDLADRKARLNKSEREIQIANAKLQQEVAELRNKSSQKDKFTGEERIKFLEDAIKLEEQILKNNEFIATEKLNIQQIQNSLSGSTTEDLNLEIQLEAELISLRTSNLEKTRRIYSELSALRNAATKEELDAIKKRNEAAGTDISQISTLTLGTKKAEFDPVKQATDVTKKIIAANAKLQEEANAAELQRFNDLQAAKGQIATALEQAATQFAKDIFNQNQDEKLQKVKDDAEAEKEILKQRLDGGLINELQYKKELEKINKKEREAEAKAVKRKALFEIGINTAVGIAKAIPNLFLMAAAAIAGGIQAAAVAATPVPKFAKGGEIGGKLHSDGGTLIEAEKGEFVVNRAGYANAPLTTELINKGIIKDGDMINGKIAPDYNRALLSKLNTTNEKMLTALLNSGVAQFTINGITYTRFADGSPTLKQMN